MTIISTEPQPEPEPEPESEPKSEPERESKSESEHSTSPPPDRSCILFQTDNVTLIDIPRSISHAQGTTTSPFRHSLISCPPLTSPFQSNEPKSAAAKARLQTRMANEHDELYATCISNALSVIRNGYQGEWCLPRSAILPTVNIGTKRKASDMDDSVRQSEPLRPSASIDPRQEHGATKPDTSFLSGDLLQYLATDDPTNSAQYTLQWRDIDGHVSDTTTFTANDPHRDGTSWHHHLSNCTDKQRMLDISSGNGQTMTFFFPPRASMYLADCASSTPFHLAVRDDARMENSPVHFEFIIMDPPWPNASVTRARDKSKSGYQTASSMWDVRQLIFETDLNVMLAPGGFMAIWITNKSAVRDLVLGEDGLFDSWGIELVEEWLWIKTTNSGQPVTALDALWRKPYEVCLLGRKPTSKHDSVGEPQEVTRRVIVAVPDLHSRKPCLKEVIEPLMSNRASYRALEVFARVLVAGWWSWGNEVLKFNNEHCWSDSNIHRHNNTSAAQS